MFTGIIQAIGEVAAVAPKGEDRRLRIATGKLDLADVALGDSIAVDGVCLTVVDLPGDGFQADVSAETLRCTALRDVRAGRRVNLEKALTPTTHLGGHLVSGHVDGLGEVVRRYSEGRSERFVMRAPDELARYIAAKGSICINGISLTVNSVSGAEFMLNIVPHTLQETTMGALQAGDVVNLEIDIIARYLERLLLGEAAADPQATLAGGSAGISEALLRRSGFIKS